MLRCGAFLLAVARNQVRKRWEKERRWDTVDDYTFEAAPTIDCGHPVAPGGGVFNLYVYPDPVWQPSTGADTYQLGASSARGMIRK
ncbi:MAG: hypothetical protein KJZ78_00925 [Bryobacteraceae bacterium]|nr:hypothetical protein [Bryobacteraceae bacterium]